MKAKQPRLVRPANPGLARILADRARGSRAGTHGHKGRNRASERRRALAFERNAA